MKLELRGLRVSCIIGDRPCERSAPQTVLLDVILEIGDAVSVSDGISDTVDYSVLSAEIAAALESARCKMIERAAKIVCDVCMAKDRVLSAEVRVKKSNAVDGLDSAVAVYSASKEYEPGPRIETIARGICVSGGKLLVCRAKGSKTCYLPGGHIEFGETGRRALEREMLEECGREVKTGGFRGVVENTFVQKGVPHSEINLVYSMQFAGPVQDGVSSREDWIEFEWVGLDKLDEAQLLPADFRRIGTDPDIRFP